MFMFKVLLFLATCLCWSAGKQNNYCSICQDHTLCKYTGMGHACVDAGAGGISKEEKKEIVDTHNWLRKLVAGGFESKGTTGPQPKAANMRKLVWDDEIAKTAQRWADQCTFAHDICRNDARWKVGQNIYWKMKYPNHRVNWTEAIISWYDEVALCDPKEVNSYKFNPNTGHYTQMIWHETSYIGCGRRDYGHNKLYVCNYGPAGNWIGEPLYTIGEPCSKCPEGNVCDEYICEFRDSNKTKVVPRNQATLEENVEEPKTTSDPSENGDKKTIPLKTNLIEEETNEIIEETRKKLKNITSELEKLMTSAIKKARRKV